MTDGWRPADGHPGTSGHKVRIPPCHRLPLKSQLHHKQNGEKVQTLVKSSESDALKALLYRARLARMLSRT